MGEKVPPGEGEKNENEVPVSENSLGKLVPPLDSQCGVISRTASTAQYICERVCVAGENQKHPGHNYSCK